MFVRSTQGVCPSSIHMTGKQRRRLCTLRSQIRNFHKNANMIGMLLIIGGVALVVASAVGGYVFIANRCGTTGAPACDADASALLSHLMIADEGLLLWLAWVVAVFLIWGGARLCSAQR